MKRENLAELVKQQSELIGQIWTRIAEHSDTGAYAFATILSFIQTINKHHLSIWSELVKTFHDDYSLLFMAAYDLIVTKGFGQALS
jgi:hypothetical protein